MELVGQMYKLSACFDTPNEYKGLPYDYFPEEAVTFGSTICSFGLSYNDHNYGMPTGLTPPVMAPHLMDPVPKPKTMTSLLSMSVKSESTNDPSFASCPVIKSALSPASSTTTTYRSSDSTPRKAYLDENDYPVYVEPEIKVVEVPENLCVSASEYSDASSESSDDTRVNPEFLYYLRSLASRHVSIERYLQKAHRQYEQHVPSPKSSESEKRETSEFVIDCICEYNYDDRRMVQCESCGIRQHLDCMYTNPRQVPNFLKHRCHNCSDIVVDISRAKALQNSRKNWHLSAQSSEKWHQRSKAKSEESRKHKDASRTLDAKNESLPIDGCNSILNSANIHRVNKRKQDLKAYGAETEKCDAEEHAKPMAEEESAEEKSAEPMESVSQPTAQKDYVEETSLFHDDPNALLSDMYAQDFSQSEELDVKPTVTPMFPSIGEDYAERLAMLNRRPQPFKKDYKEATKSLYTDKLLDKIKDLQEGEDEKKSLANAIEGLDKGPEFLERNPRCRIVLFDGCTIGLEASVRLQSGSIVCALIGRMMLMDEYLKYANPVTEHKPFVFLYHSFPEHGLVIDTSVYGNIVRYLRRSCDSNVKLEHTLISGNLYVVVRTTTDISQGVELTIPFDLPFEICQYPVQCACGKVRCPAVKHRRKHHRNRIITTSINCEQVIEDKLRELSQPLTGAPTTYSNPVKKPSLMNRYPYQSRTVSDFVSNQIDIKPSIIPIQRTPGSKLHRSATIPESRIKLEEIEPSLSEDESPELSQTRQISSDLSGDAILTTKRKPKPILHPDFEMDVSSRVLERGRASTSAVTPTKTKSEPSVKRTRTHSGNAVHLESQKMSNKEIIDRLYEVLGRVKELIHFLSDSDDSGAASCRLWKVYIDTSEFKSIITTRRQKMARPTRKTEPIVVAEMSPRRHGRAKK